MARPLEAQRVDLVAGKRDRRLESGRLEHELLPVQSHERPAQRSVRSQVRDHDRCGGGSTSTCFSRTTACRSFHGKVVVPSEYSKLTPRRRTPPACRACSRRRPRAFDAASRPTRPPRSARCRGPDCAGRPARRGSCRSGSRSRRRRRACRSRRSSPPPRTVPASRLPSCSTTAIGGRSAIAAARAGKSIRTRSARGSWTTVPSALETDAPLRASSATAAASIRLPSSRRTTIASPEPGTGAAATARMRRRSERRGRRERASGSWGRDSKDVGRTSRRRRQNGEPDFEAAIARDKRRRPTSIASPRVRGTRGFGLPRRRARRSRANASRAVAAARESSPPSPLTRPTVAFGGVLRDGQADGIRGGRARAPARGVEKLARRSRRPSVRAAATRCSTRAGAAPPITKDGVTVAEEIELADPTRTWAPSSSRKSPARPATSPATARRPRRCSTEAIFKHGLRGHAAGAAPTRLARHAQGRRSACGAWSSARQVDAKKVDGQRRDRARSPRSPPTTTPTIGKIIADAMDKVGKDGVITVEEGKTLDDRRRRRRGHAVRPRLPLAALRHQPRDDGGACFEKPLRAGARGQDQLGAEAPAAAREGEASRAGRC